jgi:hypothetical protein
MSKTVVIRPQGAVSTSRRGVLLTLTDLSGRRPRTSAGYERHSGRRVRVVPENQNFHNLSGPPRDYHLPFDEQGYRFSR